jgi:hypothetical protein
MKKLDFDELKKTKEVLTFKLSSIKIVMIKHRGKED